MEGRLTVPVVDDVQTNIDILVESLHGEFDVGVAMDGSGSLRSSSARLYPPELQ